ncbi:MAG TPA: hypothetical protein VFX92_03940 [Candidatus Krumholzibacteria bacterium]|nr:hypothetical protein [Candidatus Krumholzibacteria bacterium]
MKCIFACALLLVLPLLTATTGCNHDTGIARPPDQDFPLSRNLQSNCYAWPERAFSPGNVAALQAALPAGSRAVEFSLADLDGNVYRLSALLESKPVLLVMGTFT